MGGSGAPCNRVEVIGQSLYNQVVLTLLARMSIDKFVLTLAYRARSLVEVRFSCVNSCHVYISLCQPV